jgi:hypothetical protein
MPSLTPANLAARFIPAVSEAQQFLAALESDPGALFGFRTFDDRGEDPRLAVKAFGNLDRGIRQSRDPQKNGKPCRPWRLLQYMQSMGAGSFVVPNKLDGQGQLKRNVTAIRALYVDADSRPEVERLDDLITETGLDPTIRVASGGIHDDVEKQQCYWRVRNCPVPEFTDAQLTLVSRIGTDPAVQDAGRVMRLPGCLHLKCEPRRTRILEINQNIEYDYHEFISRMRARPQICDPSRKGGGRAQARLGQAAAVPTAGPKARLRALLDHYGTITAAVRVLLREAMAPIDGRTGNRHPTLVTIVGFCVQAGWSDTDVRSLILPIINAEWADGDWGSHLDSIITWTREQHDAALGALPAAPSWIAAAFGARGAL